MFIIVTVETRAHRRTVTRLPPVLLPPAGADPLGLSRSQGRLRTICPGRIPWTSPPKPDLPPLGGITADDWIIIVRCIIVNTSKVINTFSIHHIIFLYFKLYFFLFVPLIHLNKVKTVDATI